MVLKKSKSGFTLIELLIVIAIIGILVALSAIGMDNAFKQARDARRKSDLGQYASALAGYAAKNKGLFPYNSASSSGSVSLATVICPTYLGLNNCPEDPEFPRDNTVYYLYGVVTAASSSSGQLDGSAYVIWAKLENKIDDEVTYWVVCSEGKRGTIKASNFNATVAGVGACPSSGWVQ